MSDLYSPVLSSPLSDSEKKRIRWAVALVYFSMGLSFSSWASRIPDIRSALGLNDAELGTILLALPIGQFLMMPISGKMVTRFGSKRILMASLPLYTICMSNLGLAQTGWQLALALLLFGLSGNLCNISVNTQGVAAERIYERPIMATFHGGWSLAGFTGALIGLTMINLKVQPYYHFLTVVVVIWIIIALNHPYLVQESGVKKDVTEKRPFFGKPDPVLVQLGIIGFFSMSSEGAMFDWSGIYFKDIIQAPASLIILGYTSFMIMVATGRFIADPLIRNFGRKRLLQGSGLLISTGFFTAVAWPGLITTTLSFMLIGLGVSSVVPTVYSAAGRQTRVPSGIALATVASVSFFGFLIGPPMIGYISEAFGLRYSFAVIGLFGICITLLVSKVKALN